MPVKLYDFICDAGCGDDSIAGYLEPRVGSSTDLHRFVYWRSSNAMLPAFINCLEDGGDMRRIYTNHEQAPWVRPRGPGVKRRDNIRADNGDGSLIVEPVPMSTQRWPERVAGAGGPAPLSGGLHVAALSSTKNTDVAQDHNGYDASGLTRLLRYYMLATRTLIASSATSDFAGVHDNVGAILVSDTGAILAAGINTGSYRHAEVSLLLSWFRDHPEAHMLPAKSIVFTTLTPCKQCTRYLSLAKAPDTLIRFDEADAGRSGRVGERIAEQVDVGIDQEYESSTVSLGELATESTPASVDASRAAIRGATPRNTSTNREAERRAIRNNGTGGMSRIDHAREARQIILDAADSIGCISSRVTGRNHDTDAGDRQAETAVLAYLAKWILGARCIT